ncbi:MAG: YIP1 family protein, partial [Actinobacteria bacterium]|nr:YIP1 family protein [Actinomycetota bacterium]
MSPDRQWWLRVPAVFLSPGSVFAALRNEEQGDLDARQEPLLALVYLAGIAAVLATSTAGTLLDDAEYDSLLVVVWAVIAGGIYGLAGYFIIGGALYLGARGLGSLGTYRRARHILGLAVAPLALSLFLVWPLELAALGSDVFRTGGSDDGAADLVFDGLELGF